MDTLLDLFNYDFFTNAVLASILSSVSCGIIGTYIVSRRMVFISGGVTHASFGGIGIAWYLGLNPILGATILGVLSALGIEFMSKKTDIRQDSIIGILWALGMALGIIFIHITPGYAPNLMSYLFGSILTVSYMDMALLLILCFVLIVFFIMFVRPITYIAFDENYAKTHNAPVEFINYMMVILVALTIVFNIRLVGIILVISFLTIPQTIANMYTNSFSKIIVYSTIIGLIGSIFGLFLAYSYNIPSGATIIFSFVILFIIAKLIQLFKLSFFRRRALNKI